jgi:hypothetical protein
MLSKERKILPQAVEAYAVVKDSTLPFKTGSHKTGILRASRTGRTLISRNFFIFVSGNYFCQTLSIPQGRLRLVVLGKEIKLFYSISSGTSSLLACGFCLDQYATA